MKFKSLFASVIAAVLISASSLSHAAPEKFNIDTSGMHASIHFRTLHLGVSWLTGRFNEFSGSFTFDKEDPSANSINVDINVDSISTNHAERDGHLKGEKILNAAAFPKASFVSKSITPEGDGYKVVGDFTLHGVTKEITFNAKQTGEGMGFGKFRRGFEAETEIAFADYGYTQGIWAKLAKTATIYMALEGIQQ